LSDQCLGQSNGHCFHCATILCYRHMLQYTRIHEYANCDL
jgi:hypothetical protein